MKKIIIYDVPAVSGGALSVLKEYYEGAKKDSENHYIFVISLPHLEEKRNIRVLRYPWVKKSWFHRLYFDYFVAPKLVDQYKIDKVISLQNIVIRHKKIYQTVLIHNALPFSDYQYNFFENKYLWFYQNVIGKKIIKSIKSANEVIVQNEWIKEKIHLMCSVQKNKITVKPPSLNIQVKERFSNSKESLSTFFYPASSVPFKNHKVVIEACLKLKDEKIFDYRVILTLKKGENKNIDRLSEIIERNNLPIFFVGHLSKQEVYSYYSKSILLFASYIETVGLPLLEAKKHGSPIIAPNLPYVNETLNDYNKKKLFNVFDPVHLSQLMKEKIVESNKPLKL